MNVGPAGDKVVLSSPWAVALVRYELEEIGRPDSGDGLVGFPGER